MPVNHPAQGRGLFATGLESPRDLKEAPCRSLSICCWGLLCFVFTEAAETGGLQAHRGTEQTKPAKPVPKPRPTSPSALKQNTGTRKMTWERNVSPTQPSRQTPLKQQTHKHPHHPRLVITMHFLLSEVGDYQLDLALKANHEKTIPQLSIIINAA